MSSDGERVLQYDFHHPVTGEIYGVRSFIEAENMLSRHLLTPEETIEIVKNSNLYSFNKRLSKSLLKHNQQSLFMEMLQNKHGPGAQLCAQIHQKTLGILQRAEEHYQMCRAVGLLKGE